MRPLGLELAHSQSHLCDRILWLAIPGLHWTRRNILKHPFHPERRRLLCGAAARAAPRMDDAARGRGLLKVSRATVYKGVARGDLEHVRVRMVIRIATRQPPSR